MLKRVHHLLAIHGVQQGAAELQVLDDRRVGIDELGEDDQPRYGLVVDDCVGPLVLEL